MKVSQSLTKWRRSVSLLVVPVFCLVALAVPASAQTVSQITIPLNEYQGSGVSGMASLSAVGNYVQVSMRLNGAPIVGEHPAHIHTGTCENFDPNPIFPLTTVDLGWVDGEGGSRSLVMDVSLRDLVGDDYVILVHKSAEELTNYFVCGDISSTPLATVESDGESTGAVSVANITVQENTGATDSAHTQHGKAAASHTTAKKAEQPKVVGMPVAGAGNPEISKDSGSPLAIALGAIALGLALGGVVALMKQTSRESFTHRLRR